VDESGWARLVAGPAGGQQARFNPLIAAIAAAGPSVHPFSPSCTRPSTHLDEAKRLVLPLSSAHLTAEKWDAFVQQTLALIPHRHMPIVLGWVSGEATPQERARYCTPAKMGLPLPL
jgi:hypothetical protein